MTYKEIDGKYYELKPIKPKSLKARFTALTKRRAKFLTQKALLEIELEKTTKILDELEKLIASNEQLINQFKEGS